MGGGEACALRPPAYPHRQERRPASAARASHDRLCGHHARNYNDAHGAGTRPASAPKQRVSNYKISAYMVFRRAVLRRVKADHPSVTLSTCLDLIRDEWKNMGIPFDSTIVVANVVAPQDKCAERIDPPPPPEQLINSSFSNV